jgi:ATP-dependent RNA helicase DDX19/DBP5
VVNFDLPVDRQRNADFEIYLHKIGRACRFGKPGVAINLVEPNNMPILRKIEAHFAKEIRLLDASNTEDIENKLNNLSTS